MGADEQVRNALPLINARCMSLAREAYTQGQYSASVTSTITEARKSDPSRIAFSTHPPGSSLFTLYCCSLLLGRCWLCCWWLLCGCSAQPEQAPKTPPMASCSLIPLLGGGAVWVTRHLHPLGFGQRGATGFGGVHWWAAKSRLQEVGIRPPSNCPCSQG